MTTDNPYRVMVVDDSAVIRGLFARFLEADPEISVISSVSNGQMAIDALGRHNEIEIIVLDIEMPIMDGMTALPLLLKKKPGIQILMASTLTRKNAEISLRAMSDGAADYVAKPTSTSEIHSADAFKRELVDKVKGLASAARAGQRSAPSTSAAKVTTLPVKESSDISLRAAPAMRPEVIAIGSSTGGPQALFQLFSKLGGGITPPILITQHMPATFTSLLAGHIAKAANMPCEEGKDGDVIRAGHIYVAPGDYHMIVERCDQGDVIRLTQDEPENYCRPAVDPMLRSMAKLYGTKLLTVILTGMGSDGCKGAQDVIAAGGSVVAQDKETSIVWGMPGAVAEAGVCSAILPLADIAPYIRKLVVRSAA